MNQPDHIKKQNTTLLDNSTETKESVSSNTTTTNVYALPKRVAVLYTDAKREYFETEAVYITEKDARKDAETISTYIEKMGVETLLFAGDDDLIDNLKKAKPDMVFNLAYSVRGSDYLASTIPAILDFLNIPYTGADFFGYALNTDKFLTKKVLQQAGVPVPNYQLFNSPTDILDSNLRFPLISKLNETHCAVEITKDAVSENEKHLRERLKFLMNNYKQEVLAEEFIAGREATAIFLEGLNKKVYLGEKLFNKPNEKYVFATFEDQWLETPGTAAEDQAFAYAKYEDTLLKDYVKKAADVTKMVDYGKFDVRIDQSGRYFFIDANVNPAFGPKEMDVAIANILDMYGISFVEILRRIMLNTLYENATDNGNGNGNGHGNGNGNGHNL